MRYKQTYLIDSSSQEDYKLDKSAQEASLVAHVSTAYTSAETVSKGTALPSELPPSWPLTSAMSLKMSKRHTDDHERTACPLRFLACDDLGLVKGCCKRRALQMGLFSPSMQ